MKKVNNDGLPTTAELYADLIKELKFVNDMRLCEFAPDTFALSTFQRQTLMRRFGAAVQRARREGLLNYYIAPGEGCFWSVTDKGMMK